MELRITYLQEDDKEKAIKMITQFCKEQQKTTVIGGADEQDYVELIKQLDSFKVLSLERQFVNLIIFPLQ